MAKDEVECPICNADVPLNGDEKPGEQVYCTYCSAPLCVLVRDNDEIELEEDDF